MIEGRSAPTLGCMTRSTVGAKLTVVVIVIGMAGVTIRRRSLVSINMTGFALSVGVPSYKRKTGIAMIERYIGPLRWFMTGTAVGTELTVVIILVGMTGITILWRAFIGIVRMARFAGSICMRACQWESRIAVVERCILPLARIMTG